MAVFRNRHRRGWKTEPGPSSVVGLRRVAKSRPLYLLVVGTTVFDREHASPRLIRAINDAGWAFCSPLHITPYHREHRTTATAIADLLEAFATYGWTLESEQD